MRVLVTGAVGFVGAAIARRLAREGKDILAMDNRCASDLTLRYWGEAAERIRARQGDVSQQAAFDELEADGPFDGAVHAAALTPQPADELAQASTVVSVNVVGTANVLQWAASQPELRRLVYLSSTGVYGGAADVDLTEDLPARPSTLYGVTKLASEQMVEMFRKGCGLPAVSARVSSVFGSSEQASPGRRNLSFMHHCMDSAFHKRPVVVPDPFILHDWIYAEDVAGGVAALLGARHVPSPVYNLCSGDPVSAQAVLQVFESEAPGFEWRIVPPEEANVAYPSGRRRPSPARLATEVGFECRYDIRAGVRHYLEECRRLHTAQET